jgi:hypothetical protein
MSPTQTATETRPPGLEPVTSGPQNSPSHKNTEMQSVGLEPLTSHIAKEHSTTQTNSHMAISENLQVPPSHVPFTPPPTPKRHACPHNTTKAPAINTTTLPNSNSSAYMPKYSCPAGLDPAIHDELVDWLKGHVQLTFSAPALGSSIQGAGPQGGESGGSTQNFSLIVAPRRVRRLMRSMAVCINHQCSRIRTQQHRICNALIACSCACLAALAAALSGFHIPAAVSLSLTVGEGLAAILFVVLVVQLRRTRAPLVMMTKGGNLVDKLPQVRSWMGMALKEELDKYIAACVVHHQQVRPLTEEYFVSALLHAVGQKTPLHLTLTTAVTNDTINNDTPHNHYMNKAVASTHQWRKAHPHSGDDEEISFIRKHIDMLDLDWEPDAETQEAIDFFESILANKDQHLYKDVIFAETNLAALKAELAAPKEAFYEMDTLDQLDWLLDHPRYAAQAERIDRRAEGRRKRTQRDEASRIPRFETLQFQKAEDMKILIEIRNYLLKVTGAITDVHVQAWRNRRMSAGENPLEVFAKVKDEAFCIQEAGVLNFQADRELYALVTRKHTDRGAFFGDVLWDYVRPKVDQVREARSYLANSPDMYMEIATIWANKAHEAYIEAPATDVGFWLKIQAELNGRGKPPSWATADRAAVPSAAVKGNTQPSGSGSQTKDAKTDQKQDHKLKYYCDHCKKHGHSTDRCRVLLGLGQQAAAQQLALPAPPPVAMTVTPNAQADARDKVWKPSSSLRQQADRAGQGSTQERPKGGIRRCETCTRINGGKEVQHFIRTECVLTDASKPPPEWLNSPVASVRAEINRRRRLAGMSELPPFVPKPKKVTIAVPVMHADPGPEGGAEYSGYPLMMAIRRDPNYAAVQHSQKSRPQELLSFDRETRTFTCKACDEVCEAPIIAHNRPTHVFCQCCGLVFYSSRQLPDEWMHSTIWERKHSGVTENQLAMVVYDGGAFGSSIAETSSYAQSDLQLGPTTRAPPPVRTSPPGAPTKSVADAVVAKLGKLFPQVLRGKLSAISEFELTLAHVPAEVRDLYLDQCKQHNVSLPSFSNAQPAGVPIPPKLPGPVAFNTQPNTTTPAPTISNRFANPLINRLVQGAAQRRLEMAAASSTPVPQDPQPPAEVTGGHVPSKAEQLAAAGWELPPAPSEDGEPQPTGAPLPVGTRPGTPSDALPSTRGDDDPYREGDTYMYPADAASEHDAKVGQPATSVAGTSPRTSEAGDPMLPLPPWAPTADLRLQPSLAHQVSWTRHSWHPLRVAGHPGLPETRSVYRTDDGYVHLSVSVLKAAGVWDESWDATDGTPFLHHVSRLDARYQSAQEQVRVLEGHRDALAKDRALHKYTNVTAEIEELRAQVRQLQDSAEEAERQRAADAAAAHKAESVRASEVTLLRNSVDSLKATSETLANQVAGAASSITALSTDRDALQAQLQTLTGDAAKVRTDLGLLRRQHDVLTHSTTVFADEAHKAISVLDDDLAALGVSFNASSGAAQAAFDLATDLMDQVTDVKGQILSVANPRRDIWLASIASRSKRIDELHQASTLQLGALRQTVEGLERDFRHVPGEVRDLYRHQQANANSILTTWVHIQRIMDYLHPGWRSTTGLAAVDQLPVRYVAAIPDVDPEDYQLRLAPATIGPSNDEYLQAPNRQPEASIYSWNSRTPVASPSHADGGGGVTPTESLPLLSLEQISSLPEAEVAAYAAAHGLRCPDGSELDPARPTWQFHVPTSRTDPEPAPEPFQRTGIKVPKLRLSEVAPYSEGLEQPTSPKPAREPEAHAAEGPAAVPGPAVEPEQQPIPPATVAEQAQPMATESAPVESEPELESVRLRSPVPASPMDIDPRSVQKAPQEAPVSSQPVVAQQPGPAAQQSEPAASKPPAAPKAKPKAAPRRAKSEAASETSSISMQRDPVEYAQEPRRSSRVRVSKHENLSERALARHTSDDDDVPEPVKRVATFLPVYHSDDMQVVLDMYDYELEMDRQREEDRERVLVARAAEAEPDDKPSSNVPAWARSPAASVVGAATPRGADPAPTPTVATVATPRAETPAAPPAPSAPTDGGATSKKRRNRRRNRNRNRQDESSSEWPDVPPQMRPKVLQAIKDRYRGGVYHMDPKEQEAHDRLKSHEATVVSIDQSKLHTAVRLFSLDFQRGIVPASVMADTGAEVEMCISKGVARALNLTWTPGMQLAGVGGLGGADGQADQEIVLRIGGDGRADDVTSTPFQGSFSIKVRPVVMTEELARTIGHSALIGMSVLWRANACIDPYSETMEISPALLEHGCAGFKISVPCFMSKRPEPRHPLVGVLGFAQPPRTHESYLPPAPPAQSPQKPQSAPPKLAAGNSSPSKPQTKPPSKVLVATAAALPKPSPRS